MARPKSVDKSEKPVLSEAEIEEKQEQLDIQISNLLDRLLKSEGLAKAAFGRKIGFTQANLSNVFNQNRKKNHWSFPLLIATAEFFGTTVGGLISAAESFANSPESDAVQLFFVCRKTEPRSKERLQRLVWAAVGYDPAQVKKSDRALFELTYSVVQVEIGNPEFCNLYYSGRLTDQQVFSEFNRALEEANKPETVSPDNPPLPLWAALQKSWRGYE